MLQFKERPDPSTRVASSPIWSAASWSPTAKVKRWAVNTTTNCLYYWRSPSFLRPEPNGFLLWQKCHTGSPNLLSVLNQLTKPSSIVDQPTSKPHPPTTQPSSPTPPSSPPSSSHFATPTQSTPSPTTNTATYVTSPLSTCTRHSPPHAPTASP